MEEVGPKTRGYSLRTRSSVMTAKENVPAPKPVKKTTKKKASTGAAARRVLKDKNINVPNTEKRKTRAQLKEEQEKEKKEEEVEKEQENNKRLTRATRQKQTEKDVTEGNEDSTEDIGQDAAEETSGKQVTEDCPVLINPETVGIILPDDDQRKEDKLQEETVEEESLMTISNSPMIEEKLSANEKPEKKESSYEKEEAAVRAPPNLSSEENNSKAYTNTPSSTEQNSGTRELKEKTSFFDLPPEEQILIVRRKLERIIHKKETNHSKAVDLLRIIERMEMTEALLASTKIDLTLEALKFIIKDQVIVERTDRILQRLKKIKKEQITTVNDKKWRQPIEKTEKCSASESSSSSLLQWMDKFIESEKSKSKLDSIDKKLDSLKTGVKTLQPEKSCEEKCSNEKETNNNLQQKTEKKREKLKEIKDIRQKNEDDTFKKIEKLIHSINKLSVDDENVFFYLKDISYMEINKEVCRKTDLKATLKKLKASSQEKTQKLSKKLLHQINNENKLEPDMTDIEKSMKEINIKQKDEKFESKDNEVHDLIKRVESVSLKTRQQSQHSKLFTPLKLKSSSTVVETLPKSDDSLLKRLKHLELENNIHKIKIKLDDYKPGKCTKEELLKSLNDLKKASVTLELLESTKIGLSVNNFRKNVDDSELASLGKDIIRKWKTLVPVKTDPPAPESEPSPEEKEKQENENSAKIRAHCRSLLVSALNSSSGIPDTAKVDVERLGAAIEEAIFERFRETSVKYRSQVASRQFNIRSNVSLCENLVVGNISPDEVAVMSHEDMASEDIKRTREELRRKGFDCVPSSHQAGDKFCTCRICVPPWVMQ